MGAGLSYRLKPIEVSKKDWVEYDGIFYPPRTVAALKAAKTRKRNKHYAKYKTRTKDEQREIIIKLMLDSEKNWEKYNHERYSGYHQYAIVLESPEMLFIKKFEKHKSNIEIRIPNKEDFKKFEHYEKCYGCGNIWGQHQIKDFCSSWHDTQILLFNETYFDFVKRHFDYGTREIGEKFSVCMIWADYCGAFSSYTKDIEATFKSLLLGNHSYYAITFCTRDPGKKKFKDYSKTNCIIAVNDYVSKMAKKHGYQVELLPESGLYKYNMFTAIFLVRYELMDKAKDEIAKLLNEHVQMKRMLARKIKDLDNLVYGLQRTGEQCPDCGRWFKDVKCHQRSNSNGCNSLIKNLENW